MSLDFIVSILPAFVSGALYTLAVSVFAILFGMLLGFAIHLAYRKFNRALGPYYHFYVWVLRGTPFLVQLFIVYYGLPTIGVTPSALAAAIVTLSLYGSAYFAEIFRASWNSIPKGHAEAAVSLGIPPLSLLMRIEVPQVLRFSFPLLVNQSIIILKESSLASIITVPELTMVAGRIVSESFNFIEPYLLLAIIYWLLTLTIFKIGGYIEKRLRTD